MGSRFFFSQGGPPSIKKIAMSSHLMYLLQFSPDFYISFFDILPFHMFVSILLLLQSHGHTWYSMWPFPLPFLILTVQSCTPPFTLPFSFCWLITTVTHCCIVTVAQKNVPMFACFWKIRLVWSSDIIWQHDLFM